MRNTWLSNCVLQTYEQIVDLCCDTWKRLLDQPWRIMSVGMRAWAHGLQQTRIGIRQAGRQSRIAAYRSSPSAKKMFGITENNVTAAGRDTMSLVMTEHRRCYSATGRGLPSIVSSANRTDFQSAIKEAATSGNRMSSTFSYLSSKMAGYLHSTLEDVGAIMVEGFAAYGRAHYGCGAPSTDGSDNTLAQPCHQSDKRTALGRGVA